jgi:hypothetical protein
VLCHMICNPQVGARAIGDVCFAWPERLSRCLVLGTPSWFNMLYRMVRPHLSPNTRAKVQVRTCSSRSPQLSVVGCLVVSSLLLSKRRMLAAKMHMC